MSNIVSSVIVSSDAQADGRYSVHEVHTDVVGIAHDMFYLAESDADRNWILQSHAASLDAGLKSQEISANIDLVSSFGAVAPVTFNYSTPSDNGMALVPFAISTEGLAALNIAEYLLTFSPDDLAADSGIPLDQINVLITSKFEPMAALLSQLRAAKV